ncbi:hypothetical protein AB9E03_33795, partial [Rhizobium leguminosarum]
MPAIRTLSAEEARAAIPALSEVLVDCFAGGASVGFMQPYGPEDAEPYWRDVADDVRTPAPVPGSHQCWTSPSRYCREA